MLLMHSISGDFISVVTLQMIGFGQYCYIYTLVSHKTDSIRNDIEKCYVSVWLCVCVVCSYSGESNRICVSRVLSARNCDSIQFSFFLFSLRLCHFGNVRHTLDMT